MNERQLTDRMRVAVTDEPPLGFDPDEVVDRAGRRQRQRRRAFASVGATGATLAVVVASMVIATPEDRGTATGRTGLSEEVPTCGDVGFDGSTPKPFVNPEKSIERLDDVVPKTLAEHIDGVEFEPILDGMRTSGCAPTLMASYRAVDLGWHLTVVLSHQHDVLTPRDDRYGRPETSPPIVLEEDLDGSRLRVYDLGRSIDPSFAATRLDPDGFVVEITATKAGNQVSQQELRDLAADRDLRF